MRNAVLEGVRAGGGILGFEMGGLGLIGGKFVILGDEGS